GQATPVSQPAIGADLHQPFDVLGALAPQVALDLAVLDRLAQLHHLVLGEVLDGGVGVDLRFGENLLRRRTADPEDVCEPDFGPLVDGDVDAGDASHALALPLLVARVLADHKDRPVAAYDLAFLAHRLDGSSNLHRSESRIEHRTP